MIDKSTEIYWRLVTSPRSYKKNMWEERNENSSHLLPGKSFSQHNTMSQGHGEQHANVTTAFHVEEEENVNNIVHECSFFTWYPTISTWDFREFQL
jgi:hypothetical protein